MQTKHIPQRKCLGCGEMIGKKGALRIVRDKDGAVSVDPTGKKAGRGAYICRSADCLKAARKAHRIEKALKCPIPDEIYETIEKELNDNQ